MYENNLRRFFQMVNCLFVTKW